MTGADPDGEQFQDPAEGIFSTTEYLAGLPQPREFKPWHRPRKHFVRREQWTVQTRRIFDGRQDALPVRYLGLPGVDLLDLRYLHQEICLPLRRALRFLGFNSEARPRSNALIDLNTSLDEVRRLGDVDPQSDVIGDDFRSLARVDSIAWQRARRLGPFDVVNLDLCDGLGGDDPEQQHTLYTAIGRLLAFQVRSPYSWILLVTTRIGREHFHPEVARSLLTRFNRNLATCSDFATACEELLGTAEVAAIDPNGCEAPIYLRMMLVALCKWLIVLGQNGPNRVELASCQGYTVNPEAECEDLVSIALRFDPVIEPPADALNASAPPTLDECAEAARIVRRARQVRNIDSILEGDPATLEGLIVETERLLRAARYDGPAYRLWLASRVSNSSD